jgi:hypothetical protein
MEPKPRQLDSRSTESSSSQRPISGHRGGRWNSRLLPKAVRAGGSAELLRASGEGKAGLLVRVANAGTSLEDEFGGGLQRVAAAAA